MMSELRTLLLCRASDHQSRVGGAQEKSYRKSKKTAGNAGADSCASMR